MSPKSLKNWRRRKKIIIQVDFKAKYWSRLKCLPSWKWTHSWHPSGSKNDFLTLLHILHVRSEVRTKIISPKNKRQIQLNYKFAYFRFTCNQRCQTSWRLKVCGLIMLYKMQIYLWRPCCSAWRCRWQRWGPAPHRWPAYNSQLDGCASSEVEWSSSPPHPQLEERGKTEGSTWDGTEIVWQLMCKMFIGHAPKVDKDLHR